MKFLLAAVFAATIEASSPLPPKGYYKYDKKVPDTYRAATSYHNQVVPDNDYPGIPAYS